MVKKKELFLFFLLLLLGLFFIYIYYYIKQTEKEIFTRIETDKIKDVSYILKNIQRDIITSNSIKNPYALISLFADDAVREKYEDKMSLNITPNVKYIYILYKDEEKRFRFLLDASKEDKASFYQKFDVFNPEYEKLYESGSAQIIRQHNMENLYLTYLYPIKSNDKVLAILSVDITSDIQKTILNLLKPLGTFFIILIIFIFLLMMMSIMQIFHYFITRKKIFTDSLTNTFNRHYLKEITPMINLQHYGLAMLDLDRFKSINDTYGHKAGDYVLSQSAKILKHSIRDSDILIRYGGEEFLLLIHNRDERESTFNICERIRKNINSKIFSYDNNELKVSVSIGLHKHPAREKNLQDAIKLADKMLYVAKKDGRNRVVYYDEKSDYTSSSSKSMNFVKKSLEENRVICHYQPIYDPKNGEILKYEALVRILDKDAKFIAPMAFLPQLKHTNIHYKLTQRILSIVFEKFKNSKASVSININFSDLINEDIEATIIETFKTNPDLASRVTFEILESDEVDNITLFKEKITLLHHYKAKVSIDDFGSGYSNFKAILDIEANYLKIDGELVKNIDVNKKDFKVVKSIIHFAKEADMETIAEFVHSKEIYEKLLLLDIDYMQGYFIAKPSAKLVNKENLFEDLQKN